MKGPPIPKSAGFTLVETALAVGVVSFAMVSVMGLIPVGLGSFRNAINLSVEADVAQRLASEIQRTDFVNQATERAYFYFDGEGIAVDKTAAVFTAQVDPPQALGAGTLISAEAPVRMVAIKISNRSEPQGGNSYSVVIPVER